MTPRMNMSRESTSTIDPQALARELNRWFDLHARDLLWRAPDTSAWGILVSEVMSQQTPVKRVEPLWQAWMQKWPTPADLAVAPKADVLRLWANLGYPRRALRLQECAQACVDNHDGEVPATIAELEALPGVGSYTARAVAAFAFGQAVPVVDTNVRRVYRRLAGGEFLQGPPRAQDLADVASLLPYVDEDPALVRRQTRHPTADPLPWGDRSERGAANVLCASLMELGALVCSATKPACEMCPVKSQCRWVALGKPAPSAEENAAATGRVQKFQGTDRQVRGKIMAAVRGSDFINHKDMLILWDDKIQLERCLQSLLEDGLIETNENSKARSFRLPR